MKSKCVLSNFLIFRRFYCVPPKGKSNTEEGSSFSMFVADFPDPIVGVKNVQTQKPRDTFQPLSLKVRPLLWKESLEAAAAGNPRPAAGSHLRVSWDIKVSPDGARNSAAVFFFSSLLQKNVSLFPAGVFISICLVKSLALLFSSSLWEEQGLCLLASYL